MKVTPRTARNVAIILGWTTSFGGTIAGAMAGLPQIVLLLIFLSALLPYIISLHIVEPWLARHAEPHKEE
ncbi:MAG: hypothetical protein ACSLFQ_16770 [Thermoanaerobaculia bacterium]